MRISFLSGSDFEASPLRFLGQKETFVVSELPAELALAGVVADVTGGLADVGDAKCRVAAHGKIEAGFGKQRVTRDRYARR